MQQCRFASAPGYTTRMKPAQLAAVIVLLVPAALHADLSDRQATEEMERRASLVCADYSVARGNPGIAAVSVDAVRVLLEHRYTLCPDRRISGEAAVIWYPDWGSLVWNPERPDSLHMLDIEARQLGRTLDFPQQITVWNAKGTELTQQLVPEFHSRCTEEIFSKCF